MIQCTSAAHISDLLDQGYLAAMQNKQAEFQEFISTKTLEEAHRLAVVNSSQGLDELQSARQIGIRNPNYLISRLDHGICPVGRARCHEGKALLDSATHRNRVLRDLKGPVPPGPHGEPDCTRCVFFVTGTPFLDGLRAKFLEVSVAENKCAARHAAMVKEMDEIAEKQARATRTAERLQPYDEPRFYILKQELKTEGEVLLNLRGSLNAHGVLFQKVLALLHLHMDAKETSVPALLFDREPQFDWSLQPIGEAIDELCHLAKWYPSVRAEHLKRERRENAGRLFASQGSGIDWFSMTVDEADAAIEAITPHIYRKLKRDLARRVFDNSISFRQAGLTDVEGIIASAIGRPVPMHMPPLLAVDALQANL
jgi:hypothetical protein